MTIKLLKRRKKKFKVAIANNRSKLFICITDIFISTKMKSFFFSLNSKYNYYPHPQTTLPRNSSNASLQQDIRQVQKHCSIYYKSFQNNQ